MSYGRHSHPHPRAFRLVFSFFKVWSLFRPSKGNEDATSLTNHTQHTSLEIELFGTSTDCVPRDRDGKHVPRALVLGLPDRLFMTCMPRVRRRIRIITVLSMNGLPTAATCHSHFSEDCAAPMVLTPRDVSCTADCTAAECCVDRETYLVGAV